MERTYNSNVRLRRRRDRRDCSVVPAGRYLLIYLRNISDPRALAIVLEQAEERLAKDLHPDPYRRELSFDSS